MKREAPADTKAGYATEYFTRQMVYYVLIKSN